MADQDLIWRGNAFRHGRGSCSSVKSGERQLLHCSAERARSVATTPGGGLPGGLLEACQWDDETAAERCKQIEAVARSVIAFIRGETGVQLPEGLANYVMGYGREKPGDSEWSPHLSGAARICSVGQVIGRAGPIRSR